MAATLLSSVVFAALLLSPPGADAGANEVTWRKCKKLLLKGYFWLGVLEALPDNDVTRMLLFDCNLTEVRSGDFDGLPNVKAIDLGDNSIAHVDPAAFRTVPRLEELELSNNDLREAPVFAEHSYCPSLTTLYLHNNRITEINHPKTFSGCTKLHELWLSHNVIEYIHPDIFRPLSKLSTLHLNNNKITVIPETLFIKNNKLDVLYLENNKISYLPSDFVSKLRSAGAHLQVFFFHDNPWHCPCLLELLADVRRAGVRRVSWWGAPPPYTGTEPVCVYYGPYPCCRPAHSGLLGRDKQYICILTVQA